MSGKTKCSICHQIIDHRHEAALLPYVHPSILPSLAELGKTYIHRQCWESWESATAYSSAAYDLVKSGTPSDSPIKAKFAQDNLIVSWVPALRSYRLQDFSLLVIIDISLNDFPGFTDFLVSSISKQDFDGSYLGNTYDWEVKQMELGTEFKSLQDHELIEKFMVPNSREEMWLNVLTFSAKELQSLMVSTV